MSEIEITVILCVALTGFAWLFFRVVSMLDAGGESSARADTNAAGALPGSEQIDNAASRARAHVVPGGNAV